MILMEVGGWIGLIVLAFFVGAIGAFFLTRYLFKRQLEKNPPINEKMIRALYTSMGRKPSEADIQRTMNAVKKQAR